MWWCHLPQDRELTKPELAAVPNEELRKKLLKRYERWHEPIGRFWPTRLPSVKRTSMRPHHSRRGTRIAWFLSATPRMP